MCDATLHKHMLQSSLKFKVFMVIDCNSLLSERCQCGTRQYNWCSDNSVLAVKTGSDLSTKVES